MIPLNNGFIEPFFNSRPCTSNYTQVRPEASTAYAQVCEKTVNIRQKTVEK